MEDILALLETFIESVFSVIDFIISFFSDLIYLVEITGNALALIPSMVSSWIPDDFFIVVSAGLSIAVLYKVMGREG